ncbi:MAG: amidase family protein, partial [Chloroflexota bacterium]
GIAGSLGPMARTVRDLATLLDVMVGYDPEDPITALGAGHAPASYTGFLYPQGLQGARVGVIREPMGRFSEPDSEDFKKVAAVYDRAVDELRAAGAVLVDPLEIPQLNDLLNQRGMGDRGGSEAAFDAFFSRSAKQPFKSLAELFGTPGYRAMSSMHEVTGAMSHAHLLAAETLMFNFMQVMVEHRLDAVVHRTVEHQPTFIRDGVNPPYVNTKGVSHMNTFLVYVPAITVPAGFTSDNLPVGITFTGRPYTEGVMLKLAHGYEQATKHRRTPFTTPALAGEP